MALLLAAAYRKLAPGLSSWQWNRLFLKHHFHADEPADFHDWLDATLTGLHTRRGSRLALIAPRESAKTTWLTQAYALRCAVEGWEPHIVILSDSGEMASQLLQFHRGELENNELLAAVYPDACGAGAEWRGDRVRLKNGVLVKSLGRGSNIRGRKDKQNRPTLVFVDDCQSNRDIDSPTDRKRTLDWFLQEVVPAGSDRTNFLSIGSALHRDALAVRVQGLPGWTGRTFRALHQWPERMDLWNEWERLATNLADPARTETADAFLTARRTEMNQGSRSFWPAYKPIEVLMRRRAEIGSRRFDTEYQGIPGTPDGSVFPPEYFDYAGFWFDDWPDDEVVTVQSLDPSKGATDKSDFQGHIIVTLSTNGTLYVDAFGIREPVPMMVSRSLDLCEDHRPRCLAIETNQGLDLLLPEFARQAALRRLVAPIEGIENYSVGKRRIERLGSYLSRKAIRVRNTAGGRMLEEQLRDFPNGMNDDLPDALEIAVRMLELLTGGES